MDKKRKSNMALSSRQKAIIQMLVQMNSKPMTVAAVSEKLGVSSRTVLREMPTIEKWLVENDFHFSRKTGVGLQIIETREHLELIQELLAIENTIPSFSRDERRRRLLGELLFQTEPVKSYAFTSKYCISEGTLFADLDYLGDWLEGYQVKVIRRPGMGIFLEGEEVHIRQAIVNAVFDFFDLDRVAGLLPIHHQRLSRIEKPNPLLVFLEPDILDFVKTIVKRCRTMLHVTYTDSGVIGLHIRFALALYRLKSGKTIQTDLQDKGQLHALKEYETAVYVAEEVQRVLGLSVNRNEIAYFTRILSTARIWSDAYQFNDPMRTMNIRQVVISMAGIVEQITGLPFRADSTMIDDLVRHITVITERRFNDSISKEAQIEPVRQGYPEIYSAVETSCQVLSEWIFPRVLSDSDIGFIAMHFAAAAERIQEKDEKITVAVVCPLGVGGSRMLASGIQRYFHHIEIRKTISAFSIEEEELTREGIDLIISTTELNTSFPYVCVGKVLQAQDKLKIQDQIETINHRRLQQKVGRKREAKLVFSLKDIKEVSIIGTEIVELLQNFRIQMLDEVSGLGELREHAAALFACDPGARHRLAEGFRRREEMGDTYISEMQICMFHCKTTEVVHSRFGYVGLKKPLRREDEEIHGVVVMAVPDNLPDDQSLEPVGRLSALLIEEAGFLQALKAGDTSAGAAYAEKALVKYYQDVIVRKRNRLH